MEAKGKKGKIDGEGNGERKKGKIDEGNRERKRGKIDEGNEKKEKKWIYKKVS